MQKQKQYHLLAAVLAGVLALALGISGILAKYVRSVSISAKVTFSADLAQDVRLSEHEAQKQADGTYQLDQNKTSEQNIYSVLPGVDIPKDPSIEIIGKSPVKAYLYLEVCGVCPEDITYSLTTDWILLEGVTGQNGGKIYVYSAGGTSAAILDDNSCPKDPIGIIQNNTVIVSSSSRTHSFSLDFYGYMAQIVNNTDAAQVFQNCFGTQDGEGI